ncbi:MAG: peptidoglycan DD-metalloendopeptidase family protein [Cyclobacteriaceae bacterium]|nr:peptidoglycan DD-metalloendopeptidase family protein [Cyclobacteriaceae bacterium]
MSANKILIGLLFLFISAFTFGQKSKNQLQQEKQKNLQRIKEVEKIIGETSTRKKSTLGELAAVNQRIQEQEILIGSIQSEINLLNKEIGEDNSIITALEEDLVKMKQEYVAMLYAAQKAGNSATRLTFYFSASTFDQMVMRMRYMNQYGTLRKLQADQIIKTQNQLASQIQTTEIKRNEKNSLLFDEEEEKKQLDGLKQKQKNLVKQLEKQEKQLRQEYNETKKAIAQLDKMIEDIIREEIAKAEREAKAAAAKNKIGGTNKQSPEMVVLSASFEQNKNKLGWPAKGFVSQKFGRQNHPLLKGIVIESDGIRIQTGTNEPVNAVFEGEVRSISITPRFGTSIIIKHGTYFTIYVGLQQVKVKTGQKVKTNEELGFVAANIEGISELRFQVFKGIEPQDPILWLRDN